MRAELDQTRADIDGDVYAGMKFLEAIEPRHEPGAGEERLGAHPYEVDPRPGLDFGKFPVDAVEALCQLVKKLVAGVRESERSGAAFRKAACQPAPPTP